MEDTDIFYVEKFRLHYPGLSFRNFFQGGGKIYCSANFFCYAIVFGPNFTEGQTASGGVPCPPPPPVEESQVCVSNFNFHGPSISHSCEQTGVAISALYVTCQAETLFPAQLN